MSLFPLFSSQSFRRFLWDGDLHQRPRWQRILVQGLRLGHAIARDLTQGHLNLRAMGLVYTTLLSLVPLLAVSFSVLKGFGVHNQVEPLLLNALAPLGEKSVEISRKIIEFVDNMKVGVLGSVGLAMLLYTVISLIQKIEEAFNYTWHVARVRSFAHRFSRYLSVLLVGPVLFFTALGLAASVRSNRYLQLVLTIEPMGTLFHEFSKLVPYFLLAATFAFVYVFVPNTRVRPRSALLGALVAATLWQSMGWIFAVFLVDSTRYTAIYSGLAIVVVFMIWVYIAWVILLVGASIAFYHQHPQYLAAPAREQPLSNRRKEGLALRLAAEVARRYYQGRAPWDAEALAKTLALPSANIQYLLDLLVAGGYLLATAGDPPGYVPARDPEGTDLHSLLEFVRRARNDRGETEEGPPDPVTAELERRIDQALAQALASLRLKDLVVGAEGTAKSPPGAREEA